MNGTAIVFKKVAILDSVISAPKTASRLLLEYCKSNIHFAEGFDNRQLKKKKKKASASGSCVSS